MGRRLAGTQGAGQGAQDHPDSEMLSRLGARLCPPLNTCIEPSQFTRIAFRLPTALGVCRADYHPFTDGEMRLREARPLVPGHRHRS